MENYSCLCCIGRLFWKGEDQKQLLATTGTFAVQMVESSEVESQRQMKKKKKRIGGAKEIKLIWANNRQTNAVFSKLGAEDIVARYDKLLHEWKLLKDAEHDFKKIMGLDADRPLVKCLDSIPPDMRIGFSHGTGDSEYEFHLDVHPILSVDNLKAPLADQLKSAILLFSVISSRMNFVKTEGASIQKVLEKLIGKFKDEKETSVNIHGVRHSVELLNVQQVEQALLIVKDIITFTLERSNALMEYIVAQGDKVDMHVSKDDPENPKVIIFSKKLQSSKKQRKVSN